MAAGLTARQTGRRAVAGRPVRAALALAVALGLAACGAGASTAPPAVPPVASPPVPTIVSEAARQTRGEVVRALSAASIQVSDPQFPVVPPEDPALSTVPRIVVQALIPGDPGHGFITIYDLPDASTARSLGVRQAAWLGSGPGRVHFPADAHFTLRQVATSLVFFEWSPEGAGDPRLAEVEKALGTIGVPIDVPS